MSADFDGRRVVVAGIGISGFACADALLERGARVVVVETDDSGNRRERATVLEVLGADVRFGAEHVAGLPTDVDADLLVVSPGWDAEHPVVRDALAAGLPVWSEAELAWQLRPSADPAPWLTVTGTRGKATTATMLATMLAAHGVRATSTGQAGTSLLESVLHPEPYDVLAVQLSAHALRWSSSLQPLASVCLNVGPADLPGQYGRIYENTEIACVYNVLDPATENLVREADVIEGARAIGFSGATPAVSMLGLVEDVLCDRAFVPQRSTSAAELGTTDDVRTAGAGVLAAHNVLNALAAAALARAYGATPSAVRDGLRHYYPLPHRLNLLARRAGVDWVDDSAATDAFAAAAGLSSFASVVWIAGGHGAVPADLDAVVGRYASRLRGVVLLPGEGTAAIRQALGRHAPDVPVLDASVQDTDGVPEIEPVMRSAAGLAAGVAQSGDTVLLSPVLPAPEGEPFSARGQAFAAAVEDQPT